MEPFEQQREVNATDAAKARARELDIEIEEVEGKGSGGRITRDDVDAHAAGSHSGETDVQGDDSDPTGEQGGEPHDDQSAEPETPEPEVAEPEVEPPSADCIRFHCSTNPNFNLQSHKLGGTIRFTDGCYETDDPAEIAALRAQQCVEEVTG